jgi:hypothetical protein
MFFHPGISLISWPHKESKILFYSFTQNASFFSFDGVKNPRIIGTRWNLCMNVQRGPHPEKKEPKTNRYPKLLYYFKALFFTHPAHTFIPIQLWTLSFVLLLLYHLLMVTVLFFRVLLFRQEFRFKVKICVFFFTGAKVIAEDDYNSRGCEGDGEEKRRNYYEKVFVLQIAV